jgi:hypothetical protein
MASDSPTVYAYGVFYADRRTYTLTAPLLIQDLPPNFQLEFGDALVVKLHKFDSEKAYFAHLIKVRMAVTRSVSEGYLVMPPNYGIFKAANVGLTALARWLLKTAGEITLGIDDTIARAQVHRMSNSFASPGLLQRAADHLGRSGRYALENGLSVNISMTDWDAQYTEPGQPVTTPGVERDCFEFLNTFVEWERLVWVSSRFPVLFCSCRLPGMRGVSLDLEDIGDGWRTVDQTEKMFSLFAQQLKRCIPPKSLARFAVQGPRGLVHSVVELPLAILRPDSVVLLGNVHVTVAKSSKPIEIASLSLNGSPVPSPSDSMYTNMNVDLRNIARVKQLWLGNNVTMFAWPSERVWQLSVFNCQYLLDYSSMCRWSDAHPNGKFQAYCTDMLETEVHQLAQASERRSVDPNRSRHIRGNELHAKMLTADPTRYTRRRRHDVLWDKNSAAQDATVCQEEYESVMANIIRLRLPANPPLVIGYHANEMTAAFSEQSMQTMFGPEWHPVRFLMVDDVASGSDGLTQQTVVHSKSGVRCVSNPLCAEQGRRRRLDPFVAMLDATPPVDLLRDLAKNLGQCNTFDTPRATVREVWWVR